MPPVFAIIICQYRMGIVVGELTTDKEFDNELLIKLARTEMPFGKYKGRVLIDLPEPYVVWFAKQGFPGGEIGSLMRLLYEVKVNGLEYLLNPLRNSRSF